MIRCVLWLKLHLEVDEGEDIVLSICFIAGYLDIRWPPLGKIQG